MKDLQWFRDRVGKTVYRDDNGCDCDLCQDAKEFGVTIHNEYHASHLFDIQNDYSHEGINLNYRDEK